MKDVMLERRWLGWCVPEELGQGSRCVYVQNAYTSIHFQRVLFKARHAEGIMAGGSLMIVGQPVQPSLMHRIWEIQVSRRPCLKKSMWMDPEA